MDSNDSILESLRVWPEHRVQKGKQSGSDAGECTLCEVVEYVARKVMQDGNSLLPKKNSEV